MRAHVHLVAVLHIVLNALCLVTGLGFLAVWLLGASFVGGAAGAEHGAATGGVLGVALSLLGVLIALCLIAPGLPGFVGGIALLRGRGWARWVLVVVSALQLLNVPLGTAVGVYSLWVLLHPETDRLLSEGAPLRY